MVTERPASEISKIRPAGPSRLGRRGGAHDHPPFGISRDRGSVVAWLGVNQHNHRAQRFYTKMGFTRVGEKTFDLNGNVEHDYVLSRRL